MPTGWGWVWMLRQAGLWLAAHNLAAALMVGAEGVGQDFEQARKYLALVAELGLPYGNWMGQTGE